MRLPARAAAVAVVGLALLLPQSASVTAPTEAATFPTLSASRLVGGLDLPWDVKRLPSGELLVTERDTRQLKVWNPRTRRTRVVSPALPGMWASGETGLMGLTLDKGFSTNRRFYTCQGAIANGTPSVRVVAWSMNRTRTHATRLGALVTGIQATSGRHGGCRLLIGTKGPLYVGTGDAAVGTNPENKQSLNGKVLRIDPANGKPWPSNPFVHATNAKQRLVYNQGHRNVQGLAQRPGGGVWSIEQGTDRDDEVNQVSAGADYGYNPVPGYNESVPMTDFSLPGPQVGARWRSGYPTIATSGGTWVRGKEWGPYDGTLAVAALKGQRLVFMKFDRSGTLLWTRAPGVMRTFGRLRSVSRMPDGALLVTTSNDNGTNAIIRAHPR